MQVELDVFSGRPNPCWELEPADRDELWELQSRLSVSLRPPAPVPALGYRGFRYPHATGPVHAYRGSIWTTAGLLVDPSSTIERYLLTRLPAAFAALGSRIRTELESSQ